MAAGGARGSARGSRRREPRQAVAQQLRRVGGRVARAERVAARARAARVRRRDVAAHGLLLRGVLGRAPGRAHDLAASVLPRGPGDAQRAAPAPRGGRGRGRGAGEPRDRSGRRLVRERGRWRGARRGGHDAPPPERVQPEVHGRRRLHGRRVAAHDAARARRRRPHPPAGLSGRVRRRVPRARPGALRGRRDAALRLPDGPPARGRAAGPAHVPLRHAAGDRRRRAAARLLRGDVARGAAGGDARGVRAAAEVEAGAPRDRRRRGLRGRAAGAVLHPDGRAATGPAAARRRVRGRRGARAPGDGLPALPRARGGAAPVGGARARPAAESRPGPRRAGGVRRGLVAAGVPAARVRPVRGRVPHDARRGGAAGLVRRLLRAGRGGLGRVPGGLARTAREPPPREPGRPVAVRPLARPEAAAAGHAQAGLLHPGVLAQARRRADALPDAVLRRRCLLFRGRGAAGEPPPGRRRGRQGGDPRARRGLSSPNWAAARAD